MAENDFNNIRSSSISSLNNKRQSDYFLITIERSQKLDLLIHLINNLRQSLIICGPIGIGKTTLLDILLKKESSDWFCCAVPGTQKLSFESVLEKMTEIMKQSQTDFSGFNLDQYLSKLSKQNKKIVLMIDDAGKLVPGLFDALNRYSLAYPALRIIFALTQDELYVKTRSDKTVEDCHFIELPPLSEKQCEEFLQNLSGKPSAAISFSSINENMIGYLYQETHGIPGKIIEKIPDLNKFDKKNANNNLVILTIAFLILFGSGYWFFSIDKDEKKQHHAINESSYAKTNQIEFIPTKPNQSHPVTELRNKQIEKHTDSITEDQYLSSDKILPAERSNNEIGLSLTETKTETEVRQNSIDASEQKQNLEAEMSTAIESLQSQLENQVIKKIPQVSPQVEISGGQIGKINTLQGKSSQKAVPIDKKLNEITPNKQKPIVKIKDDIQWLLSLPPNHFTLQLIALSNRQSLSAQKKKYAKYGYSFRHIPLKKNGVETHIMLSGSFNDYKEAKKAIKNLPKEFKNSWVRKISSLQTALKK